MLEKVKPGDLAILSDGDQARVTKVEITPTRNYILHFDKPVSRTTGMGRYRDWEYKQSGEIDYLTNNEDVSIVKIIAE